MLKIKVSAKRQATFPKQVCESLGIAPGDDLLLDRRVESGKSFWVIAPAKTAARPWLGSLRDYAKGKDHSMEGVRASIAKARQDDL